MHIGEWFLASSVAVLTAVLTAGCAVEPSEGDIAETAMAVSTTNGVYANGLHVNGLHVNGLHVNGLHVNGTSINGVFVSGTSLTATSFSGTSNSVPVSGLDFIGARLSAALADGTPVQLRIEDIQPSTDAEILFYDVSSSLDGVNWSPLCVSPTGAPVQSFPLSGYWNESEGTPTGGDHIDDPSQFTFACRGFALAKCTEMGYKPWSSVKECTSAGACHDVPLSFHHEACTRMLRADYCGDGMATTRDGTLIDVYDGVSIQSSAMPAWTFEAEWGYDGATCIKQTRWPTIEGVSDPKAASVKAYIDAHCPNRWAGRMNKTCGSVSSTMYTATGFTAPLTTRSS